MITMVALKSERWNQMTLWFQSNLCKFIIYLKTKRELSNPKAWAHLAPLSVRARHVYTFFTMSLSPFCVSSSVAQGLPFRCLAGPGSSRRVVFVARYKWIIIFNYWGGLAFTPVYTILLC